MTVVFAILKAVWGVLRAIPWQVYAVVAVVTAIFAVHVHLLNKAVDEQKQVDEAQCAAEKKAERDARDRANALANAQLAEKARALAIARESAELDRQREEARHQAELLDLQRRKDAYVGPNVLKDSRCSDVPRGYLLWRTDTAAFANGAQLPAGPQAKDGPLDEPSGVSLSALADTDLAQADAFRKARQWGSEWRDYALELKTYCEDTLTTLKGKP